MTPEISEFSYGFALTNEIVGWSPLKAAPVFPSLIEEGRTGGGYDVKLELPAVALYLQFKRSECMLRRNAKEIRTHNLNLHIPFYRFNITQKLRSNQHDMLLSLSATTGNVYYAAPVFSTLEEINSAWIANEVASRSIFLSPEEIGELDNDAHHIAFDGYGAFLCSDPRPIEFLDSKRLVETLTKSLQTDGRPLRKKIPEIQASLWRARTQAESRRLERGLRDDTFYSDTFQPTPSRDFVRRSQPEPPER